MKNEQALCHQTSNWYQLAAYRKGRRHCLKARPTVVAGAMNPHSLRVMVRKASFVAAAWSMADTARHVSHRERASAGTSEGRGRNRRACNRASWRETFHDAARHPLPWRVMTSPRVVTGTRHMFCCARGA